MTETDETEHAINRRKLLKASGATAIGITAFSDPVTATPPEEIRFCGCSQVCVYSTHSYRIFYATEEEDGYSCRLAPSTDEDEPREPGCYTAGEGEKVLGVLGGTRKVYHNPNNCARRALVDVDFNNCSGCDDDNCNESVNYSRDGKHRYMVEENNVVVKTRKCKPPEKWTPVPNGTLDDISDTLRSITRLGRFY